MSKSTMHDAQKSVSFVDLVSASLTANRRSFRALRRVRIQKYNININQTAADYKTLPSDSVKFSQYHMTWLMRTALSDRACTSSVALPFGGSRCSK